MDKLGKNLYNYFHGTKKQEETFLQQLIPVCDTAFL